MCEGQCNTVVTNMKKRLEGESSCSATIWGASRRGTPSCFLNPSWMLLLNTTNKTQKYPKLQNVPLLNEVNKSSWDETSGYSVWKRPLILGLTLLRPVFFTSDSHWLFMRFRITYFALPLKFLSLSLMSSPVGPFSLPAGPTLLVPMVLLLLRTCTCSPRPCSRAMSLQCFQHLHTPFT